MKQVPSTKKGVTNKAEVGGQKKRGRGLNFPEHELLTAQMEIYNCVSSCRVWDGTCMDFCSIQAVSGILQQSRDLILRFFWRVIINISFYASFPILFRCCDWSVQLLYFVADTNQSLLASQRQSPQLPRNRPPCPASRGGVADC